MSEVSSLINPKRMITLTDADCRILNSELNLNFKRLGVGIKSLFQLYVDYYMTNPKIDPEKGLFIPSAVLAKHSARHYQAIRKAICQMKGFSSYKQGICDLIIGWKPEFSDVLIDVSKNHAIFNSRGRQIKKDIVLPGADLANYTQSVDSGRYYHPMQNISRVYRNNLFSGCDDIDIVSCFTNIFLRDLKTSTINNYYYYNTCDLTALMPLINRLTNKSKLHQDLLEANIRPFKSQGQSPDKIAKALRSRLFNHAFCKQRGIIVPNRRLGCGWYDDLSDEIYRHIIAMGIKDSHFYFSTEEQKIIAQVVELLGPNNVLLNLHDGLILKPNTITQDVMLKVNNIQPYISFKHNII